MGNSAIEDLIIGVNIFIFVIALTIAIFLMNTVTDMSDRANEVIKSETGLKEVWVYVTNPSEVEITDLTFKLEVKYNTLIFNESEFINVSKFKKKDDGTLDTVRLLNSSILVRAMDTTITDENKTIYDEAFNSNEITGISDVNERKLIRAEDDYGTSYVFRGAVKDNYVDFAGFTWRIVRINGDGSIRLILDGTLDKICGEYNEDNTCDTYAGTTISFNFAYNDNAYVGYMYGLAGTTTNANRCLILKRTTLSAIEVIDYIFTYGTQETCEANGGKWTTTAYEATHANVKDSAIKEYIDRFYESYIENSANNIHYEQYLADTMFCGDKSLAQDGIGAVSTQLGYGTNKTYYAATERLWYSSGTTSFSSIKPAIPTLKCAENANNNYSRYTSTIDTSNTLPNGLSINNDLKHPIALLSADELVMAGAFTEINNQSYYLYDAYANGTSKHGWWTMSPYNFNGSDSVELGSYGGVSSLGHYFSVTFNDGGSRPVINLRSDVLIESGDGTKERTYDEEGNVLTEGPYTVK